MVAISPEDIAARLAADNPWWSESDHLKRKPFTFPRRDYFPKLRQLVLAPPNRAVVVMGARRVGKTTMLRQLIADLRESGEFSAILYASVDAPTYAGLSLSRLIEFFEVTSRPKPQDRRLVIFDEIQYLADWERHLKDLVDRFPETKFVVSGSSGAALKRRSTESGAGRFTDFELPPLTFAEYLRFKNLENDLISEAGAPRNVKDFQTRSIDRLNAAFIDYVNYGSYPEAVFDQGVTEDFERFAGRDIVDKVLLKDLPSIYGIDDIQELNKLFSNLAYNTAREVSLEGLSQNAGVAKNTIQKYIDYLEAAFLLFRLKRVDETARRFQRQRQFKVYLANTSMRTALFGPVGPDDARFGFIAETAAVSQWLHSPEHQLLHYANWTGGEVDVVKLASGTFKPQWAYEVKWSDTAGLQYDEVKGIVGFCKKNGLRECGVSTKTVSLTNHFDGVEVRLFPLALQCYALGKIMTR